MNHEKLTRPSLEERVEQLSGMVAEVSLILTSVEMGTYEAEDGLEKVSKAVEKSYLYMGYDSDEEYTEWVTRIESSTSGPHEGA